MTNARMKDSHGWGRASRAIACVLALLVALPGTYLTPGGLTPRLAAAAGNASPFDLGPSEQEHEGAEVPPSLAAHGPTRATGRVVAIEAQPGQRSARMPRPGPRPTSSAGPCRPAGRSLLPWLQRLTC